MAYVPYRYKSYELCLEAVKNNGTALAYVIEKHKSYELCLEAAKQNKLAIINVPEKYRTKEFYKEIADDSILKNKLKPFIDNGKHIFEYIPNKIKELQAI